MAAGAAHNFFHQRDNWRMYIFDFTIFSSQDWRIGHALSHHPFPNTIYDYEVSAFEPFLQFLPKKTKTLFGRYFCVLNSQIIFMLSFFIESGGRLVLALKRKIELNREDFIVIVELLVLFAVNGSFINGLK